MEPLGRLISSSTRGSMPEQISQGQEGGKQFVESISPRIKTVDDLIKATKLDLDKFEIERGILNKWEVGTALKTLKKEGFNSTQTGKVLVEPLFQVKIFFKPKDMRIQLMAELKDRLIADIKALAPTRSKAPIIKSVGEKLMLEFGVMDLHVGKFAVAEESGDDYTVKHACELFEHAVLSGFKDTAHMNISQILWPVGNDMLQFDDIEGHTTRGTLVNGTGRYFQIYRAASKLYRWAIQESLKVAPVKFITVPGNHDYKSVFHLGEELAAWFHATSGVTFDVEAKPRKYHRFGVNLLGFTHGNEENINILGALMAKESKRDWVATSQHEWHLGHNHRSKIITESANGVRVRWLPSLSATDSWHFKKGFVDRRSSEAYVWGSKSGYKSHFSFNVL